MKMKKNLKVFACILTAVILAAGLCLPTGVNAATVEKALTTAVTTAGEGNVEGSAVSMPGGWAGMKITVGDKDIKVTALGRWYTSQSNATHNFLVANMDGSIVVDYGNAVATAEAGAEEGFVYGTLTTPVTLTKNTSYYIVSDYWGAMDKFYSGATSTTTDAAKIDGVVILNGSSWDFYEAANVGWGPLDLKYEVEENDPTPPAGEGGSEGEGTVNPPEGGDGTANPPVGENQDTQKKVKKESVPFTSKVTIAGPGNVAGSNVSMPTGWAGMRITVGNKDIEVTALGRWYTKGSAASHNFLIVNTDGSLVLDYGKAIASAPAGAEEGFVYGDIEGGVVLKANTTYYIVSDYMGADDKFYASAESTHSNVATMDGIVILEGEEWKFYEAANTGWGPLDFKYVSEGEPKTGDAAELPMIVCVICMAFSACGLILVGKKRRTS